MDLEENKVFRYNLNHREHFAPFSLLINVNLTF